MHLMAKGTGTDWRQGNLDTSRVWSSSHYYYRHCQPQTLSESFKKRRKAAYRSTYARNISILQQNIFKIFEGSLHSDLYIIHGSNVLQTNCCILKTRSPHLYNCLKKYFAYNKNPIKCYLNTPEIFHQIEGFVRLLYCNLDVSRQEHSLIEFISHIEDTIPINGLLERRSRSETNDDVVDLSPSTSDMADSGLETGSVSFHENTESENSGTDLEESHVTDYVSTDDDFIRVSLSGGVEKSGNKNTTPHHHNDCCNRDPINNEGTETISSDVCACGANQSANQMRRDSSRDEIRTCDIVDDVTRYENEVLNDPFYESDSNDNEPSGSFVPTGSFEFVEPGSLSPTAIAPRREDFFNSPQDEKLCSNPETRSMIVENLRHGLSHSNDLTLKKSSSSINSYCFIDASSLNDETEVASISVRRGEPISGASLPTCLETVNYVPTKSFDTEEPSNKICRKSLQSGHERTAEFERELKLTEYLKPIVEPRKIKRVDSISEEKPEGKPTEKEALVVEIKEADSGESNHPSPCIDNNKKAQRENEETAVVNDSMTEENLSDSRRSSLIRRNTFELESGDEKLSQLRQEYERRQGNLVFKNSIPQYSGHRVDGDLSCNVTNYSSVPFFPESVAHDNKDADNARYLSRQNDSYTLSQSLVETTRSFDKGDPRQADNSNALYPIAKSASDKFVGAGSETDDSSIADCNSLPTTFDFPIDGTRPGTMKRSKRDEMTPIVSGGVSTIDYSKPTDSPSVRRKTESTPIVSGGSVLTNVPSKKIRSNRMSSSMNAWVVDMSYCGKVNQRFSNGSSSSSMSQSYSCSDSANKDLNKVKAPEKQGSLGFFVNLKDIDSPKQTPSSIVQQGKTDKEASKQSCEFFVDISKEPEKITKNSKKLESKDKAHPIDDKKNIFSMFIDLGEPSKKKSGEDTKGNKPNLLQARGSDDSGKECGSESSQEARSMEKKPSVFLYIDSDSPVVRRRTLSTPRSAVQRHSWNVDKPQVQGNGHTKEPAFRHEHKRAHSVSIDPAIQKTLLTKASGSSLLLTQIGRAISLQVPEGPHEKDSNATTSAEMFDYEIRDTPPNSHVEIMNDDLRGCVKRQEYAELMRSEMCSSAEVSADPKVPEDDQSEVSLWDKTGTESTEGHTRKSETFDISSGSASGPSPGSDKDFELGEYRNGTQTFTERRRETEHPVPSKIAETHKSLTETIKKIECEFNKPEYGTPEATYEDVQSDSKMTMSEAKDSKETASCSGFVRLSDLDKTPAKSEAVETEERLRPKSLPYRMSTSIPEMSWVESKLAVNRTNGPCQVRTLSSRKFTSIMSTSLPAKHKSPIEEFGNECEGEGIISESDLSSMQSSMGRSGADVSTEETETSSFAGVKQYNRLGEDLLRMFLEEINPDVTIDISGRRIRAHKCILSSRCQYFAAILSGGWIESAGNVISLQGYSYSAVHFALCHIYSGESNIPDSISIVELATLADMLCLEGLKEVIGYTIKVKYCHLFHKPCQLCAVGVLECMPLAAAYGLDEVYRKSLRWVTRHFVRIWPCKAFAALPRELMDKCYHQHIVHMSADNVLQTIMDCDKLLATLPNVRWAEPVFRMVSNLLEAGLKFLSDNFSSVLSNDTFQALGRDLTWNISRLEDNVLAAADRLPPDQACKSYSKLHKMLAAAQSDDPQVKPQWGTLFVDFLVKIQTRVEKCLVKEATRAARTTTWLKMDLELRRRIQELACLVILPHEALKRPSRHSNFMKESKTPPSRTSASRSLDLRRVKMTISEQNDKTLKPTTVQPAKKILPKPKSDPLERKMQDVKPLAAESAIRPKSWPNKLEVKSRYLEARTKSVPKESTQQTLPERILAQQRRKIMISSSDSSRTSSPAMKRAIDKKPMIKIKPAVKKDVKALSSDSLTEATGVKTSTKREATSKSCGITRPESPSLKPKDIDIGLSADSLAEPKKKPLTVKKTSKMDTSMSTDSLMTEVAGTPKSSTSNKISPTLGRPTAKSLALERAKKSSPPMNQKSPLSVARRPARSIESSTAASRNRVAAINAYHGSPNLRRNLLDAAKTPDVPSKIVNGVVPRVNLRQNAPSTSTPPSMKRDKKESTPSSSESPSKRSPKSNGMNRPSRVTQVVKKNIGKGTEDKIKTKCHNGEALKQLTVGSRSGTFLKDEPTILKKSDMKTTQVTS